MISRTHNGPVDLYLQATGKTMEEFERALLNGDPAVASIFSAEVLYRALQDLEEHVEEIEFMLRMQD